QQRLEYRQQGAAGARRGDRVVAVERGLGQFHEPVAELVPGELVQRLREQVETVGGEVLRGLGRGGGEAGEDPLLGVGGRRRRGRGGVEALRVHQHEAGRVPQLVAEVLVALGAAEVDLDVAARPRQRG